MSIYRDVVEAKEQDRKRSRLGFVALPAFLALPQVAHQLMLSRSVKRTHAMTPKASDQFNSSAAMRKAKMQSSIRPMLLPVILQVATGPVTG
jgi:hypothetical protein